MQTRPAARMLIIDPQERILLFQTETAPMDQEQAIPGYWYVPGGGVEHGETFEDAARRELWEEVGLKDVTIGPCVWWREQVLRFSSMGEALAHERFFVVRVPHASISFRNMVDQEAEVLSAHRWWTVDELQKGSVSETFVFERRSCYFSRTADHQFDTQPIASYSGPSSISSRVWSCC